MIDPSTISIAGGPPVTPTATVTTAATAQPPGTSASSPPGEDFVTLCGRRYPARKYRLVDDLREAEQYLLNRRKAPLAAIAPELAALKDLPEARDALLKIAYEDLRRPDDMKHLTPTEVAGWLRTPDGLAFSIHQVTRDLNPELKDLEVVKRLVWTMVREAGEKFVEEKLLEQRNKLVQQQQEGGAPSTASVAQPAPAST